MCVSVKELVTYKKRQDRDNNAINIFINSLYATFFYTKNLCFIEEHCMFRHISAIIRCYQFSIYNAKHIKKLCLKVTQHKFFV
jgi:hypothetical protein